MCVYVANEYADTLLLKWVLIPRVVVYYADKDDILSLTLKDKSSEIR